MAVTKKAYSLRELSTFGDVAAEDDAVLEYFLTTDAVTRIKSGDVFLVLGRKGAGKTALVRHFAEGNGNGVSRSLNLGGYPWAVHAQRMDRGSSDVEAYVSSWRYFIVVQLAVLALARAPRAADENAKALRRFLADNYGDAIELDDILRPAKLRLSNLSFEPMVFGCKLGGVALDRNKGDLKLGMELDALSSMILSSTLKLAQAAGAPSLMLHFDELDQGIATLTEERARMLAGLVLAARSVRQASGGGGGLPVNPVIYLRSDLWDKLSFSDKNKISESLALRLEWDSDSLFDLVNARVRARMGKAATWDAITTPDTLRGSYTKWNYILGRTFLRPRDVIKFLNSALKQARTRDEEPLLLSNPDVVNAREPYSAYLKAELDDEIMAHWPQWEEALQACSAISTMTFQRDEFAEEYEERRSKNNSVGTDEALELLYRFSVIGYERRSGYGGSSWAFQYTNPEAGWDNRATRFKVHQGLKEFAKLRED